MIWGKRQNRGAVQEFGCGLNRTAVSNSESAHGKLQLSLRKWGLLVILALIVKNIHHCNLANFA